jgi:hypothetical protein
MKNKVLKLLSLITLLGVVGCNNNITSSTVTSGTSSDVVSQETSATSGTSSDVVSQETSSEAEFVDYASNLKLDLTSTRKRCEATLKCGIDGDTSHFYVDIEGSGIEKGVLKARYLGIDTPESTGRVEPWGKVASLFTTGKLETEGVKIILESDDDKWNVDSTGTRYLVYVWYKTPDMTDYKNLNLEIMQEGLSVAKGSAGLCYGDYFMGALNQALNRKIKVFSDDPAPYYYYGEYQEVTIKGLKEAPKDYENVVVRFEGLITKVNNSTAYVVDYDEDTGLTYGVQVYYGPGSFTGDALMQVGNKVSICGTYIYYTNGHTYQVSGLTYMPLRKNEKNLKLIEENCPVVPYEVTGADFEDTEKKEEYNGLSRREIMLHTYVTSKNLVVKDVYTTKTGDHAGAMSITCEDASGKTVNVRTELLYKEDKETLLTEDEIKGKTITVTGIVDIYVQEGQTDEQYQIRVFGIKDLVIVE